MASPHCSPRSIALTLLTLISLVMAIPNSIYILRNAETPSLGIEGLSPVGKQRATSCIPSVFSATSTYNIGLVMACRKDVNTTDCHTAVDTATPLATALKLTLDTSCATIESNVTSETCVPDRIKTFAKTSTKNILIVWDVEHLDDLLDEFDLENDGPDYPEQNADVVFSIRNNHFVSQVSLNCPGIDGAATGGTTTTAAATANKVIANGASHNSFGGGDATTDSIPAEGAPVAGETLPEESAVSSTASEPVATSTEASAPTETPAAESESAASPVETATEVSAPEASTPAVDVTQRKAKRMVKKRRHAMRKRRL
ncbi:hypothetical protein HGRIS_012561 [Hohenbuehelia grisea]|uniref:Uncharacterized protein n=1 Tax=Hohenbuehelia grisea TaxID=104357 RepID=A0ABR3ISP3_9AGAR